MLVQAAADEWKARPPECLAASSVITHIPTGRTACYGQVAEAGRQLTPPENVQLKDLDWKLAGRWRGWTQWTKTTGAQVYGSRPQLPGMQRNHPRLPGLRRQVKCQRRRH